VSMSHGSGANGGVTSVMSIKLLMSRHVTWQVKHQIWRSKLGEFVQSQTSCSARLLMNGVVRDGSFMLAAWQASSPAICRSADLKALALFSVIPVLSLSVGQLPVRHAAVTGQGWPLCYRAGSVTS
jgi:hypothetical protein